MRLRSYKKKHTGSTTPGSAQNDMDVKSLAPGVGKRSRKATHTHINWEDTNVRKLGQLLRDERTHREIGEVSFSYVNHWMDCHWMDCSDTMQSTLVAHLMRLPSK